MVCDRCKMVVEAELDRLGLHPELVSLGRAELKEDTLSPEQLTDIGNRFHEIGFELLEDRDSQIVEQIKTTIIELIHQQNDDTAIKHSEYIAQRIGHPYPYLSKLFTDSEGTTIEQYLIHQKIEKVKELLTYGEHTLSQIAWQLGYSSVTALSAQFKKVVGITPSEWKSGGGDRVTLDKVGRV